MWENFEEDRVLAKKRTDMIKGVIDVLNTSGDKGDDELRRERKVYREELERLDDKMGKFFTNPSVDLIVELSEERIREIFEKREYVGGAINGISTILGELPIEIAISRESGG